MELFGYVCSAYCQSQAEKLKIEVPIFGGQKALVERRCWRKVRWVAAAAMVMVLALLGAYSWYYFVGSRPRVLYTMRFPSSEHGNFAKLMSPDQVLLRQGKQLSRYDLRADKGMDWVPSSAWLTKIGIDVAAPSLSYDLAVDASGRNRPSVVAAGLGLGAAASDFSIGVPDPASLAAWVPGLLVIVGGVIFIGWLMRHRPAGGQPKS